MKHLRSLQPVAMTLFLGALPASAQSAPRVQHDAKVEVPILLSEFLSKVDSSAMHERFWADDLIYFSSGGVARDKAGILKLVTAAEGKAAEGEAEDAAAKAGAKKTEEPKVTFSAEDVTIRQFSDIAVLNYRLVQHTPGAPDESYLNSGVLALRSGKWQVISWQTTKVPLPEAKK